MLPAGGRAFRRGARRLALPLSGLALKLNERMSREPVKPEDLSPNDPRAVVEDPVVMREEARLRVFGRIFMLGLRIAAVAMLLVVLIPAQTSPDSAMGLIRAIAIHVSWIALVIALVGPVIKMIADRRSVR